MVTYWVEDSLRKVFQNEGPSAEASQEIHLAAARNEREDVQVCLRSESAYREVRVELSQLLGPGRACIPASALTANFVGYVPLFENTANNGDGEHILRRAPDFFPDPFLEWPVVSLKPNRTQPLWITVAVPEGTPAGSYHGSVTITADSESLVVPITVEVWPFALPRKTSMWNTNWFSTGCLEEWYGIKRFSEEWWTWVDRVAQNMGEHLHNTILTPLFELVRISRQGDGFTFDCGNLDRWIETFDRHGVADRIEGSHLGGRGGNWESAFVFRGLTVYKADGSPEQLPAAPVDDPARRGLLRDFLIALKAHLADRGWWDRFILHQADEPVPANEASYRQMAGFVREVLPDVPRVDAVMADGLVGCLEIRVPQIQELRDGFHNEGEELWSYTCLAPQGPYPNRFLDFSSLKTRIIPWVNWRYGAIGYLHWGYAHWSSWGGSRGAVDPWSNATGGSERLPVGRLPLPPGDPHVVYPGQEKICNSIRWEMVRKGTEDYEYLKLVEQGIARLGEDNPVAAKAQALLKEIATDLLRSNSEYTRSDAALQQARQRLAAMIVELEAQTG
ncbi:DUF4091 domain-containing protein [bacterium]|nr:DUF4091 domain-containing protein [bacterium]